MRIFIVLALLSLSNHSYAQCIQLSGEGDTLMPVINRSLTIKPFEFGRQESTPIITAMSVTGNTLYAAGSFQYIGPNTGSGIMMNLDGTQILTPKKWRINGPVHTSISDGKGGLYIGGEFSRIGDFDCSNIAHLDENGQPFNWAPDIDDAVNVLTLFNDSLFIGGIFDSVDHQPRWGFAGFNVSTNVLLPASGIHMGLDSHSEIYALQRYKDRIFVGSVNHSWGSFFIFNPRNGNVTKRADDLQLTRVHTLHLSNDQTKLYIGGEANVNDQAGICIDPATTRIQYYIKAGSKNVANRSFIYSIKTYGNTVYIGGSFNYGQVQGAYFNQTGIFAYDETTLAPRDILKDCDGMVTHIACNNDKIYLGGEFSGIGKKETPRFAVFDTTKNEILANTLSTSDKVNTITFLGTSLFIGGHAASWGCVKRNGFAAFDINTGEIKQWQPKLTVYGYGITDMIATNEAVYIAGDFNPAAFKVTNTTDGADITPDIHYGVGRKLLLDGTNLYLSLDKSGALIKMQTPTANQIRSWRPGHGFDVKAMFKRGSQIIVIGDDHAVMNSSSTGMIAELTDNGTTVTTKRIHKFNDRYNGERFGFLAGAVLVNDNVYFSGNFDQINRKPRNNFASFNINTWTLNEWTLKLPENRYKSLYPYEHVYGKMQAINGTIYSYGDGILGNAERFRLLFPIDTIIGAIMPGKLRVNARFDSRTVLDERNVPIRERSVNVFFEKNGFAYVGGSFGDINRNGFVSFAKARMQTGGSRPAKPSGIQGDSVLALPGSEYAFSIKNADNRMGYAWYFSGDSVTISNNGYAQVKLSVKSTATNGTLKAIAINECGISDTVFLPIRFRSKEPTLNVTNLRVVRKTDTTATIKFTKGNGGRRMIIIRQADSITVSPKDSLSYSANTKFGDGSQIQSNAFVVYQGSSDSVNVTGLLHSTNYLVKAFELEGPDNNPNYLLENAPSAGFITSANRPNINAKGARVTNLTETGLTITFSPGNGAHRLVVLSPGSSQKALPKFDSVYLSDARYGAGDHLGNGNYIVALDDTIVNITGLTENSTYRLDVYEYNGVKGTTNYLIPSYTAYGMNTLAAEPTKQASNIVVTENIDGSTVKLNCTPGNGVARLVVIRKHLPTEFVPQDARLYEASPFPIHTDSTIVVGRNTPVSVTGLIPNTKYYISVFEFNGNSRWNYRTDSVPTLGFTTAKAPPTKIGAEPSYYLLDSTTAVVTYLPGNGDARLHSLREGSPIIEHPKNGIAYTMDSVFGKGSQIGDKTFAVGEVFIKNGFHQFRIYGLKPSMKYYLTIYEYYRRDTILYRTENARKLEIETRGTFTPSAPTIAASALKISAISPTSAKIESVAGNGDNRLIVIKRDTGFNSVPVNDVAYKTSAIYGQGQEIEPGVFSVAENSSVVVTGLSSDTRYTVSVFEYNAFGNSRKYLSTGNPKQDFITNVAQPSVQASNITVSSITENSAIIDATPGNGHYRVVLIAEDSLYNSYPDDGMPLTADSEFGKGTLIKNHAFVVSISSTPVIVTGLKPDKKYQVTVLEANGTGTRSNYLISNEQRKTFTTKSLQPLTQASQLEIVNISASEATIRCIAGSGSGRLVLIQEGNVISEQPVDGKTYLPNPTFGAGDPVVTSAYVISTDVLPVTVKNLQPNKEYTISVFEYNTSASLIDYLQSGAPVKTFKTGVIRSANGIDVGGAIVGSYPNPVTGRYFTTSINTEKRGLFAIEIVTAEGSTVKTQSLIISNDQSEIKIDLSNVPSNTILIVRYHFNNDVVVKRFLKM